MEEKKVENQSVIIEFWEFLRVRKRYWLLPIVIVLFLFGALIVFTESSAVAPFIYALFQEKFYYTLPQLFENFKVLLQFSWRRGSKDSGGQRVKCLLSNDFIIVLSILSTAAILEVMSATALLICNVTQNLSSSEDTFVICFFIQMQTQPTQIWLNF